MQAGHISNNILPNLFIQIYLEPNENYTIDLYKNFKCKHYFNQRNVPLLKLVYKVIRG